MSYGGVSSIYLSAQLFVLTDVSVVNHQKLLYQMKGKQHTLDLQAKPCFKLGKKLCGYSLKRAI